MAFLDGKDVFSSLDRLRQEFDFPTAYAGGSLLLLLFWLVNVSLS